MYKGRGVGVRVVDTQGGIPQKLLRVTLASTGLGSSVIPEVGFQVGWFMYPKSKTHHRRTQLVSGTPLYVSGVLLGCRYTYESIGRDTPS